MSDTVRITTNNVPRNIIDAYELTEKERAEFDYLNWSAIDEGSDSASFIRFKGTLYDLSEFMAWTNPPANSPLAKWHGYHSDSFFSGLVIRYCNDHDSVIVGTYYA